MKGLVVDAPWIDFLMDGTKTWEMRTRPTKVRGLVALIRKGSGTVVAKGTLVDSLPPLTRESYPDFEERHRIPADRQAGATEGGWVYPWVFEDVERLLEPVPYVHPLGAVIWVNLPGILS